MEVVSQATYDKKTFKKYVRSLRDIIHRPVPKPNNHGFYDTETTYDGFRSCPFCFNVSLSTKEFSHLTCNACHKEFIDRGKWGWELVKQVERRY